MKRIVSSLSCVLVLQFSPGLYANGDPGVVTPLSPSGTITERSPAFVWTADPHATKYKLRVNDSTGKKKVNTWYTIEEAGCTSGTGNCSITPTYQLADGDGAWKVRAANQTSTAPFSELMPFTVVSGNGKPGIVTLVSPGGSISDNTPDYVWTADPYATKYKLRVNDSSGSKKVNNWYSVEDAGCTSGTGTCSVNPGYQLADGDGSWKVRAASESSLAPFSDLKLFTVTTGGGGKPGIVTLVSPAGTISERAPDYIWEADPYATKYKLRVNDSTGTKKVNSWFTASEAGCESGTGICSIDPGYALADGDGSWKVRAADESFVAPFSGLLYFVVNLGGVNLPPVANDNTATVIQGIPRVIDVVANDEDPDGSVDEGSVEIVTDPDHGSITAIRQDGTVEYTPGAAYTGPDSFSYTVKDDEGAKSNVATVNITVVSPGGSGKPNIVFMLVDDLGYGDSLAYNPESKINMPSLESLANDGMKFTDAHTPAAKCAPSRYGALTGNYQWRGLKSWGQWDYKGGSQILDGQLTIAAMLRNAGYATSIFGKLHMGGDFYLKGSDQFADASDSDQSVDFSRGLKNGPLTYGFDYSFVALRGIQASPYAFFENDELVGDSKDLVMWDEGVYGDSEIVSDGIGLPDWDSSQVGPQLTQKAIEFIDQHHDRNIQNQTAIPFFMFYASQSAHGPQTPPQLFLGEPVKGVTGINDRADMVYEMDVALGKLMDALQQRGLLNDTLIIFTSDNGGNPKEKQEEKFGHFANAPLRGEKGDTYEGGHRVPLVVRWDGNIPAGSTSHHLIGIQDMMATLAALTGQSIPPEQARDSFNILPIFLGLQPEGEEIRDHIIVQGDKREVPVPRHFAFRSGDWKLIFDEDDDPVALFNLADDLEETVNLVDEATQQDRIQEMTTEYLQLRDSDRTAP